MNETAKIFTFPTKPRSSDLDDLFKEGVAAEERGEPDEALSYYAEAFRQDPHRADALLNIGGIYLRSKFEKKIRLSLAECFFKKALGIDPGYALAHFDLALCFELQDGCDDEALQHYRTCVRLSPNYAEARLNLALLCAKKGLREEARIHYRAFLKLAPADDPERHNAAIALALLFSTDSLRLVPKPLERQTPHPHSRSARRRAAKKRRSDQQQTS